MSLADFLNKKPLYYKEIDYERMPRVWAKIKKHFNLPKIIHIVGTNGKGSSGRFLAYYLYKSGFKTGHYTSPHILKFNERIWINGKDIDDESLEKFHKNLLFILSKEDANSLSYFEYTTLLAVFAMQTCDYIVLEAGLGGEYDATSVFDNILTLVTSIDFDHKAFLGDSIEEIARTKLNAVKKAMILSMQEHIEVFNIALEISKKKKTEIYLYNNFLTNNELILSGVFIKKRAFPPFFYKNLTLAISGVKFLGLDVDFSKLEDIEFFGRCQKISKNITIDVGHNPLAARALRDSFENRKVVLVYNSYEDKDYEEILNILKPIIKRVEIIDLNEKRVAKKEDLEKVLKKLSLDFRDFNKIKEDEEYLVFGSFLVVEKFLKGFYEK